MSKRNWFLDFLFPIWYKLKNIHFFSLFEDDTKKLEDALASRCQRLDAVGFTFTVSAEMLSFMPQDEFHLCSASLY